MKRRARTNSKVPAKGRLRDMCDQLWSLAVRDDWGHKCAVCSCGNCEAHHLIPRQHEATRYDLRNGVALCPSHHKFDKDVSPHLNAAGWMQWLGVHHRELLAWYVSNPSPSFKGTKNASYYCDILLSLREYVDDSTWERIVGVRFAAWLSEREPAESGS